VCHELDVQQVRQHGPTLADIRAVTTYSGLDAVAAEIVVVVQPRDPSGGAGQGWATPKIAPPDWALLLTAPRQTTAQ